MLNIMSYGRFKKIMETIINYDKKIERISDFMEKEVAEDSYCFITLGRDVQTALINTLADEFNCWYSLSEKPISHWWANNKNYGSENDISWWLYTDPENRVIYIQGKEVRVKTLPKFYDYLVESYMNKKLEGYEPNFEGNIKDEDPLDLIKGIFGSQFDISK